MTEQETTQTTTTESPSILERIAQDIILAYAWVAGPALSEQQRLQRELTKARQIEREIASNSITWS